MNFTADKYINMDTISQLSPLVFYVETSWFSIEKNTSTNVQRNQDFEWF